MSRKRGVGSNSLQICRAERVVYSREGVLKSPGEPSVDPPLTYLGIHIFQPQMLSTVQYCSALLQVGRTVAGFCKLVVTGTILILTHCYQWFLFCILHFES